MKVSGSFSEASLDAEPSHAPVPFEVLFHFNLDSWIFNSCFRLFSAISATVRTFFILEIWNIFTCLLPGISFSCKGLMIPTTISPLNARRWGGKKWRPLLVRSLVMRAVIKHHVRLAGFARRHMLVESWNEKTTQALNPSLSQINLETSHFSIQSVESSTKAAERRTLCENRHISLCLSHSRSRLRWGLIAPQMQRSGLTRSGLLPQMPHLKCGMRRGGQKPE